MDELRIDINKLNLYSSQLKKNYEHYKNCFSDSFFCYADIANEEKIIIERMQNRINEQLQRINNDYEKQIRIMDEYVEEINNIEESLYSGKNSVKDSEIHMMIEKLPYLDDKLIDFGEIVQVTYDKNLNNSDNNKNEKMVINNQKMASYNDIPDMDLDDLIEINVNR